MRKALIVGIDHYASVPPLSGCVNDAHDVEAALQKNGDGSPNFDCKLLTATDTNTAVTKSNLRQAAVDLFDGDPDIALFYFAGHGHETETGGCLIASDTREGPDGLAMGDIMTLASKSNARNKVILLDSCRSGGIASSPLDASLSTLTEGTTILTACTNDQYAVEKNGSGLFTSLLVDALTGAAANLVGDITPGAVYAHIDQSLGEWNQRPIFKTNIKRFVSLKKVDPPIATADLRRIVEFFPNESSRYQLDPSFEPESPSPDPASTAIFAVLQNMNRVNLVVPDGAPHMYHAAMDGKACRLTALGAHYRRLVAAKLI